MLKVYRLNYYHSRFVLFVLCMIVSIIMGDFAHASAKPVSGAKMIGIKSGELRSAANLVDGCLPVSTMACSELKVGMPFNLSFDAAVSGTIGDKDGQGTGFRTVNSYSGGRAAEDGQPAVPGLPGYEPSRITLGGGRLQIVANKGIDYLTNNNQLNALGVKIDAVSKFQLEVKVVNPFNGSQAQQAGIWYGISDNTFIKLGITGNRVELRKELNDVSSTVSGTGNPDQRRTEPISGLNSRTVTLRMVIDSQANTVEGFYSTDGVTYISTGALYSSPYLNLSGTGLTQGEMFAGVFSTYRNGSSAVTYTFDDFAISNLTVEPPVAETVQIDFLPSANTVASGFTADNGLPFDAGRKFGWINAATQAPSDYSGNMRLRAGSGDAKQMTLVQMQSAVDNAAPGAWEHTVANGLYTVTVGAGDDRYYDSNHQINVEGLPVITDFRPSAQSKYRVGTATVQVNDGKLTINATGGTNTKMTYLTFKPATTVSDAIAPVASARFEGTVLSPNVYDKKVQVILTASDAGDSGLKTFQYAINGGSYTNYTAPFLIETGGNYSLTVKAADANNNETITSAYTFTVYTEPAVEPIKIDFLPAANTVASGFTADNGLPFDAGRKFGWVNAATQVPSDYSGNMRLRAGSGDAKQMTLVQMQSAVDNAAPGAWEHTVANGLYTVTVGAGDDRYYDSNHQINVEGLPVITDFRPSAQSKYRVGTATVQVNDGKLTINATGGTNTKMTYLTFKPATTVSDAIAPVASARFEGTVLSPNVYDKKVQVILTASDAGDSGLKTFQYAINGGSYTNYTAPFLIETGGNYSLTVKAADANNNETITSAYTFTVYTEPAVEPIKIDFLPAANTVASGFTADNGLPFDAGRKFGWVNAATQVPSDYSGNMRLRAGSGDAKQMTLVQMQSAVDNAAPGAWEHVVPNGRYTVTVGAGDDRYYDSNHQINVEGLPVITDFISSAQNKFRIGTATVQVNDGKLTINATGGTNTKMTYLTFSPATIVNDDISPIASAKLVGTLRSSNVYDEQVQIVLTANDEGGSGLALFQYALNDGTFINYTGPFTIENGGNYSLTIKAADGNGNQTFTSPYNFSVYKQPTTGAYMVLKNLDNFPADDQLVFSSIQTPWRRTSPEITPYNANHDRVKLRINSKGTGRLVISNLRLSNTDAWKIVSVNSDTTAKLPISITTGSYADVTIMFMAKDAASRAKVFHDTLAITSNDSISPLKRVLLHGLYQKSGEGRNEPYAQEIINAFGFTSKTGYGATDGTVKGSAVITTSSHEVPFSYLVRADESKPVTVYQLAAYHSCCASTETIRYFAKGSSSTTSLFNHNDLDGQSLLPRLRNSNSSLAQGSFSPTGAFGFKVSISSSDRTQNDGNIIGLRLVRAIDANGNVIPNAYFLNHDYINVSVTNYDYQDNMYYVENVRPETGTVHYSTLESISSSAVSFNPINTGANATIPVTLKNQGKTYPDNTSDPSAVVKSIKITGPNANEFSVGSLSATTIPIQTTAALNVKFSPTSVGIKNAALLITYNNASGPLRIPLYGIANNSSSVVSVVKRIKGGSDTDMMIGNNLYENDKNYRKGSVRLDKQVTLSDVAGTDIDSLYQTYLSAAADLAETSYEIPVSNGDYLIRMHFVENYFTATGSRVFSTTIENQAVLNNLDIFSEVKYRTALVKDFSTTVTDGVLNIKFNPVVNRLALAGLELFRVSNPNARMAAAEETSFEESGAAKSIFVYPNPTSGSEFNLSASNFGRNEKVTVTITSLSNRIIETQTIITDGTGGANIPVQLKNKLNSGMYIISASSASGVVHSKLVVEK
ncbi:OmpL47-type beta-barrel domain-containing protein [Dyadobacter bucti]|uniref:OmpL47-type beta-barrel domain-containing protein n=1 Tax=Dyadobacter bucti TaxID=2572203 RepID=UPI001107E088|nr:malectin domain-containing carbohydrate-binding protein [Dyadobacter bucti]